jgi:hypothetical protein
MTSTSTVACLAIAEARLALEYLARAEQWAAGIDDSIVSDMRVVHQRLLARIETLRPGAGGDAGEVSSMLHVEVDGRLPHKI